MVALSHLIACVTTQTVHHDQFLGNVQARLDGVIEKSEPHIKRNRAGEVCSVASLNKSLQDYVVQFKQDHGYQDQLDQAQQDRLKADLEADDAYGVLVADLEEAQGVEASLQKRAQKVISSAHLFPMHLRESITGQSFQQKMATYLQALGLDDLTSLPKDKAKELVTQIFQEIVNEAHARKMAEIWKMIFEMLLQNMRSMH